MAKVIRFIKNKDASIQELKDFEESLINSGETHVDGIDATICGIQLDGDDGVHATYANDYVTCELCLAVVEKIKALRKWKKPSEVK